MQHAAGLRVPTHTQHRLPTAFLPSCAAGRQQHRFHGPRTSATADPSLSRAAATTDGSRPSRSAMLSALLRPGMPHSSLHVTAGGKR